MNISIQKYIGFFYIVVFIIGLVLRQLLQEFGLSISGLDYIIWFIFFCQICFLGLLKNKFSVPLIYWTVFLLILIFIILNFFTSNYINSLNSYLLGSIFTIIFPLTFLGSYTIRFDREHIFNFVRSYLKTITFLLVIIIIEKTIFLIFNLSNVPSMFLKTYGFAGTLASINIVLSLFLYKMTNQKKYMIVLAFSFLVIIFLSLLKAVVSSTIIVILYIYIFSKKFDIKKIIYPSIVILLILVVLFNNKYTKTKIENYKRYYLQSSGENLTPRLLLYREAFHIAKDHFPFGSGQGTFGSFPVSENYSNVYIDYGLSNKQGLMFRKKPNFLFDTYWSSILGEMGFIACFLYLILFFYPALMVRKYLKYKSTKPFAFLIIAIIFGVFIESLALAIPYQISFIILYAGLAGIISRNLKEIQFKNLKY